VAVNGINPTVLWGEIPPEQEDVVALTEEDLLKIRTVVQEEIEEALPRIWDDPLVDFIADGAEKVRPKTALKRLLERTA
jgi:hypothetical protein